MAGGRGRRAPPQARPKPSLRERRLAAALAPPPEPAAPDPTAALAKARIGEIERIIGCQQAGLDFFNVPYRPGHGWDARSVRAKLYAVTQAMTSSSPLQGTAVDQLCHLGRLSRAGYYRLTCASGASIPDIRGM